MRILGQKGPFWIIIDQKGNGRTDRHTDGGGESKDPPTPRIKFSFKRVVDEQNRKKFQNFPNQKRIRFMSKKNPKKKEKKNE